MTVIPVNVQTSTGADRLTEVIPATVLSLLQRFLMSAGCTAASLTVVSGTAGIVNRHQRKARREKDAGLARALLTDGLPAFVQTWYKQPMWQSLRAHARYSIAYCLPSPAIPPRNLCTMPASCPSGGIMQ